MEVGIYDCIRNSGKNILCFFFSRLIHLNTGTNENKASNEPNEDYKIQSLHKSGHISSLLLVPPSDITTNCSMLNAWISLDAVKARVTS